MDDGWKSAGSGVSYRKKHGVVYIVGEATTIPIQANSYNTVGSLPSNALPDLDYPFFVDSAGSETLIIGRVRTNGDIQVYSKVETTYWNFSLSFPV